MLMDKVCVLLQFSAYEAVCQIVPSFHIVLIETIHLPPYISWVEERNYCFQFRVVVAHALNLSFHVREKQTCHI